MESKPVTLTVREFATIMLGLSASTIINVLFAIWIGVLL